MKKIISIISIILAFTLLFAFVSCGNGETPSVEVPPDYSKIYFDRSDYAKRYIKYSGNIALSWLATINDRNDILQAFDILEGIDYGDGVTAEISFDADEFEGIDCTKLTTELKFSFDQMTKEEIAESLEKISTIPNVTKIECYFYQNLPAISDT